MYKRILLITTVMGLLFLSCDIFPSGPDVLSNEEHAVISAVLDTLKESRSIETIDVYDLTSTSVSIYSLSIAFNQDSVGSPALLNNYNSVNIERCALDIDLLPDYVMLKDTDEAEPYSGYTSFTRPGISDDGTLAVVEYSAVSAPLAGSGMAAVLEKTDGKWIIIWLEMMWIS